MGGLAGLDSNHMLRFENFGLRSKYLQVFGGRGDTYFFLACGDAAAPLHSNIIEVFRW